MILTVTLNPAVDKTMLISRMIIGSVNRADEVENVIGGKGINVAKVLKQYDYDVKTMGFLGGYYGKMVSDEIEKMGISQKFTFVNGETRTSVNVISEDGYVTEFLEPGPMISQEEIDAFLEDFKKELENEDITIVDISGSAPKGVSPDFYAKLITIAKDYGKKVILDASGEFLKKGAYARPYMIKPNLKELETLMGRRVQGIQEICESAVSLIEWGISHVMVSMGSRGILYAYDAKDEIKTIYVSAPVIKAVNTVGSGDSAVAAFAMSITEGLEPTEIVKRSVAVSVANALVVENGILDKEKVEEIYEGLSFVSPAM